MKNGMNIWQNADGDQVKSPTRPAGEWYPAFPASRVRGERYTPYQGRSEWEQAANAAMAAAAKYNFQNR